MKALRANGYFTLRDQIKAAARVPLAFEPGTRFLYGFASELTARLLEVLCDKPAEQVIKEMLFEPLDMDSSANFLFGDLESRLVKNYYLKPGKTLARSWLVWPFRIKYTKLPLSGLLERFPALPAHYQLSWLHKVDADAGKRWHTQWRTYSRKKNHRSDPYEYPDSNYDKGRFLQWLSCRIRLRIWYAYPDEPLRRSAQGMLGQFGWTGGSGTWAECDPGNRTFHCIYAHLQPNLEQYHHLRMREVAYGCL